MRVVIGILSGVILGGACGLFVVTPLLTIVLMFLGIIQDGSAPPWVATFAAFALFLSINMGIYLGIKWARRSKNNILSGDTGQRAD